MLAGIRLQDRPVGYVAANPAYGARGGQRLRARLRGRCGRDAHGLVQGLCAGGGTAAELLRPTGYHPLLTPAAAASLAGRNRDYGLCRRLFAGRQLAAGGSAGLEVGSVLYRHHPLHLQRAHGESEASGKAVNYWWGLQSDAERWTTTRSWRAVTPNC